MNFKKCLILFIILSVWFIQIVTPISISGEPTPEKPSNAADKSCTEDNHVSSELIELIKSGSGSDIVINKNVDNCEYCLTGECIFVSVEVMQTNKYPQNIHIMEIIDDDLELINTSGYSYKLNSLQDVCVYRTMPYKLDQILSNKIYTTIITNESINKNLYGTTNVIHIDRDDKLKSNELLAYWYCVKSSTPGTFYVDTIVTEGNNHTLDAEYPLALVVSNPEFSVDVECRTLQIYKNEPINIEYNINYIGDYCQPICKNVSIVLDKDNKYYDYIGIDATNDNPPFNLEKDRTFNLNNISNKSITIRYGNSGSYLLPGITINDKTYNFRDTLVTVDTPFQRHNLILVLSLILSSIGTLSIEFSKKGTVYGMVKSERIKIALSSLILYISGLTIISGILSATYIISLQIRVYIPWFYNHTIWVLFVIVILTVPAFIKLFKTIYNLLCAHRIIKPML